MFVNIGPYKRDLIPISSIEYSYLEWRFGDEEHTLSWYDVVVCFFFSVLKKLTNPINRWQRNAPRQIEVRIDDFDVWSLDHTLAHIIHPALIRLKENGIGGPFVDPNDVPSDLRPSSPPGPDNGYVDDTHFERWNYVLDEMIWAFGQTIEEESNESFFANGAFLAKKYTEYNDRRNNGYRLFGKYYASLWD